MVRHHLVQRIIRAYDEHKTHVAEQQMLLLAGGKNDGRSLDVRAANGKSQEALDASDRAPEASGE